MNAPLAPVYGAIDAGGTKWACAVGTSPSDIRATQVIPTTSPPETLAAVIRFFTEWTEENGSLAALGVSCFGPLIRDRKHPKWGHITNTPKPGWTDVSVAPVLGQALGVPVGFDTDINGAAMAEHRWGAAAGVDDFAYINIGTGVGGTLVSNGQIVTGRMHSEMGHIRPRRHPDDPFEGSCPFHGDCYEGLVSGAAIQAAAGKSAKDLDGEDPRWDIVAYYIAQLCCTLVYVASTEKIVLGGGVMKQGHLLPRVGREMLKGFHRYLDWPYDDDIECVLCVSKWVHEEPPSGLNATMLGSFILARQAICRD